jgi:nitrile hydratase
VSDTKLASLASHNKVVLATDEVPLFEVDEPVRVLTRTPIGHYRVPLYLRGKRGVVKKVLEPRFVDNEQEGYGRDAGSKRHYYRVAFPMRELWAGYKGSERDELRIEVYETWLERI